MSEISWLDRLSGAILRYLSADMLQRGTIEFVGNGVVLTDDAANDKTVVSIVSDPEIVAVAAFDIDWSLGDIFTLTLSGGADTITFSNVGTKRKTIILHLTGAGGTVTLPTILWPAGVVPTQTASGKDTYTFTFDGTDVRGTSLQAFA